MLKASAIVHQYGSNIRPQEANADSVQVSAYHPAYMFMTPLY